MPSLFGSSQKEMECFLYGKTIHPTAVNKVSLRSVCICSATPFFCYLFPWYDSVRWSYTVCLPFQSQLLFFIRMWAVSQPLLSTINTNQRRTFHLNCRSKWFVRWLCSMLWVEVKRVCIKCLFGRLFDSLWASQPLTCIFILLFTSLDNTSNWVLLGGKGKHNASESRTSVIRSYFTAWRECLGLHYSYKNVDSYSDENSFDY